MGPTLCCRVPLHSLSDWAASLQEELLVLLCGLERVVHAAYS